MTPERQKFLVALTDLAIHQSIGYWSQVTAYHWHDSPLWVSAYVTERQGRGFLLDPNIMGSGICRIDRAARVGLSIGIDPYTIGVILEADKQEVSDAVTWRHCDAIVQVFFFGERIYSPPTD